ncbi:MAG: ABC transporter permease [Bradyrhizobium sp.]|nr:MAG: ABC transporter permease [Bradyrhizobium sp.]
MAPNASATSPTSDAPRAGRRRLPAELSILGVMIGMMILFEILGWIFVGQSFIANPLRLKIMILQEAEIGIIAVGVTQIIIMGGIDLSSGSVVGMTAMIAASLAQVAGYSHAIYPSLTGLNPIFPVAAGLLCGLVAGLINGSLIAFTKIPPFIATLGMMVSARGVADWYTNGQPIGNLDDPFAAIGSGWWPVIIFLGVAFIFHIALRFTRYGKFTYAIGANLLAARVSGINVERHMVLVYSIAGLLSGLSGVVHTARAISGQAGVGAGFELDAIAASVIGGSSLSGGVGRITGTVIGAVILGILTSGFTFLNVDAHYQEIIKGGVIIAAVVADQYRQRRRKSV